MLWWAGIISVLSLSDDGTIVGGPFGRAVAFVSRFPLSPWVVLLWGMVGLLVGFVSSLCRDLWVAAAAAVGMIIGGVYALLTNSFDGWLASTMPGSCFSCSFVGLLLGVVLSAKRDLSKVKQSTPNDHRMAYLPEATLREQTVLLGRGYSYQLHSRALAFLLVSFLLAAILQFFPFDRSEGNKFVVAVETQIGFPLAYASIGLGSIDVNVIALLADILVMAGIIALLMCWWQRWAGSLWETQPWQLHPQTWIFLAAISLGGVLLEMLPFTYEYTDRERMNLPDNLPGNHWSGRGEPFAYYRVDSAESLDPRPPGMDAPSRFVFDSTISVFDFLLLGLAIGETTYWFERWQRMRGQIVIQEE